MCSYFLIQNGFGREQMDCVEHAPGIQGNAFHAVGPRRPGYRLGETGFRQSWEIFSVITYCTEPWARCMSTLQHNYLMGKMGGKWNLPQRILWESLIMHVKHTAQCPMANGSAADWSSFVILCVHLHVWESEVSSNNKIYDCYCSVTKSSHFYTYELWKGIQMWETPA